MVVDSKSSIKNKISKCLNESLKFEKLKYYQHVCKHKMHKEMDVCVCLGYIFKSYDLSDCEDDDSKLTNDHMLWWMLCVYIYGLRYTCCVSA